MMSLKKKSDLNILATWRNDQRVFIDWVYSIYFTLSIDNIVINCRVPTEMDTIEKLHKVLYFY